MRLVWAISLLACACSVRPKEVPSEPGTFTDADDIAPVWFLANPANQFRLFHFLGFRVESVALAACPVSTEVALHQVDVVGDGCSDGDGIVWFGTDEKVELDAETTHTLQHFGVDVTEQHHATGDDHVEYWTIHGSATIVDDDGSWEWRSDLAFERRFDDVTRLGWVRTEAIYTLDGHFTATSLNGRVGVEDWGTAEVDGHDLPTSYDLCEDSAALTIEGANAITVDFSQCDAPTFTLDGEEGPLPVATAESQLGVPSLNED